MRRQVLLLVVLSGCGGEITVPDAAELDPDASAALDAARLDAAVLDSPDAAAPDALLVIDALLADDAATVDARLTIGDAGAVSCEPVATTELVRDLAGLPFEVSPRHVSAEWQLTFDNGVSVNHVLAPVAGTVSTISGLLLDPSGLSSASAMRALTSYGVRGSDDVVVVGTPAGTDEIWIWSTVSARARVVGPGVLAGGAVPLGSDTLLAARTDGGGVHAMLASTGGEVALGVASSSELAFGVGPSGGAWVAAAHPTACEVLALSADGVVSDRMTVPVPDGCDRVALASLGGTRAALAIVSGGRLLHTRVDRASGDVEGFADLGPALPGDLSVVGDDAGAVRITWQRAATELGSTAISSDGSLARSSCVTADLGAPDFARARSARFGDTTVVVLGPAGRAGRGLRQATFRD